MIKNSDNVISDSSSSMIDKRKDLITKKKSSKSIIDKIGINLEIAKLDKKLMNPDFAKHNKL